MKNIFIVTLLLLSLFLNKTYSQQISKDNYRGQWANKTTWASGSWSTGTPVLTNLPNPTTLPGGNITIYGYVEIGTAPAPNADVLTFATNNDAYTFTIKDTLVVYGNVDFKTDAMKLELGPGAVFIVFGNVSMNNKMDINSTGTFVVQGALDKTGGVGTFAGTGDVFAGSYTGGAEALVNSNGENSYTIEELSVRGFTQIENFVTGGGTYPLPIELTYFKAQTIKTNVTLNWQTATELNNDYFTLERSADGVNYENIGTVAGAGTSMIALNYSYTDNNPLNGVSYYRLKQTDYDGKFEVFNPVSVSYLNESELKISTNPASKEVIINMGGEAGTGVAKIYNVIGVLVKTIKINDNYTTINVSDLPLGTYILVVSAGKTQITKKIMVK